MLWISFGCGQNIKSIPVHELVYSIGPEKSRGILNFHAFTGCDIVSAFRGRRKKTAWMTWDVFSEIIATFAKLSETPSCVSESDMRILEQFVVALYDRRSSSARVDDARLELFAQKARCMMQFHHQVLHSKSMQIVQHTKLALSGDM